MLGILITLIVLVSVKVTPCRKFVITAPVSYLLTTLLGKALCGIFLWPQHTRNAGLEALSLTCNFCVNPSIAQHSTAQHSTAQHSTAQHSTAQLSTAQHGTAAVQACSVSFKLCLVQHSTAQRDTTHTSVKLLVLSLIQTLFGAAQYSTA